MKIPPPEHSPAEFGYDHEAYLDAGSLKRELRRVGERASRRRS